jgi:hypothetical protein
MILLSRDIFECTFGHFDRSKQWSQVSCRPTNLKGARAPNSCFQHFLVRCGDHKGLPLERWPCT